MLDVPKEPRGELVMRTLAMPSDTNANGDLFGGWIVSQMDLGGGIIAKSHSPFGRAVTVAIDKMVFINPVKVGEVVSTYGEVIRFGNKSLTVKIETWTYDYATQEMKIVTSGTFTYVAIDLTGKSVPIICDKKD